MANPEKTEKGKLTASDWERGALELIAEQGINAVAVESLARRMGITKGSFYWHFPNRQALIEQSLLRWLEHDERNLQLLMDAIEDPRERLILFFRRSTQVHKLTHDVYTALCFAPDHPLVEPVLAAVAERRTSYLANAFCELGMDTESANFRARLTYAAYVGYLQLMQQEQAPVPESPEFEAYLEHVIKTLIPTV
ncbi:MAG: TetR/AcrR family transcriptional regulator [Xanthomonadales bacterium]|nr:TetR/AcrR family transcriptional regulator [Xanthomonadales bacterium]